MKIIKKIIFLAMFISMLGWGQTIEATDTSVSTFLSSKSYNNIYSDATFVDIDSMSVAEIQSFLEDQNSYLKGYRDSSATGGNRTAAQIIYDAARGLYGAAVGTAHNITIDSHTGTINPKVILVYLQKEQSLISRTTRNDTALNRAMGYMCPDGSGCDPDYEGFAMQVGWGAWQLRYNFEAAKKGASWWVQEYGAGNSSTAYVGLVKTISDYTGSYSVTYSNAATASVYRYTPHVFDSAYNAWSIFLDWFSPTVVPPAGNDTKSYTLRTYKSSLSVTGGKDAECTTHCGSTMLADTEKTSWKLSLSSLPIGTTTKTIVYKNSEGEQVGTKSIKIIRHKTADISGDGKINITDLSILSSNWEKSNPSNSMSDINSDKKVNIVDLSLLSSNWGK